LHYCGGDVLEVGCGSGRFLNKLARHDRVQNVTGLDVSLSMLRRSAAQGHANLVHSPAENLPFLSESFDTVASTWSALKYVDREKGFAEIHRVLRPGGMLTFDLINHWPYWLDYVWREYLSQYRLPPRGLARSEYILSSNMRDARREVNLLQGAGFEIIELKSIPYLPFLRRHLTQMCYWNGYWGSRVGYDTVFVCRKMLR
jgi:ubiquinone/menaquinone biosynthesis C-methylase UbiE